MSRILDPKFKYVPSFETDIKKRFDRIRKEQKEKAEAKPPVNVRVLRRIVGR